MKFSDTIKKNHEFRRLYSKGKSAAAPSVVVYCRRNGRNTNRIGITVSNKIGKAVQRNKIRRRIREIYRLNEERFKRGFDIVVVARVRSRYADYRELEQAILNAGSRLGILTLEKGDRR